MKHILILFAIFSIIACKSKNEKEPVNNEVVNDSIEMATPSTPTDFNKLAISEEDEEILLGRIDRKGLQRSQFKPWFDSIYHEYSVDTANLGKINPLLPNVDIQIFMGTWCEDSQREIPALFKVLDASTFNYENLDLVAVNREKQTPQKFESNYNIEYVPTILFISDTTELGRIVEYTQESLEKDMLTILSGEGYKHAYED